MTRLEIYMALFEASVCWCISMKSHGVWANFRFWSMITASKSNIKEYIVDPFILTLFFLLAMMMAELQSVLHDSFSSRQQKLSHLLYVAVLNFLLKSNEDKLQRVCFLSGVCAHPTHQAEQRQREESGLRAYRRQAFNWLSATLRLGPPAAVW